MSKSRHKSQKISLKDLTLRDVWILFKYLLTAEIACILIFVLPYLLFFGALSGLESLSSGVSVSKWLSILIGGIIVYFIVRNLSDLLRNLSEMFAELGKATQNMSFVKKLFMFLLIIFYLYLWRIRPKVAFLIGTLVLIPAGYTYDKYKKILREKIIPQ